MNCSERSQHVNMPIVYFSSYCLLYQRFRYILFWIFFPIKNVVKKVLRCFVVTKMVTISMLQQTLCIKRLFTDYEYFVRFYSFNDYDSHKCIFIVKSILRLMIS